MTNNIFVYDSRKSIQQFISATITVKNLININVIAVDLNLQEP